MPLSLEIITPHGVVYDELGLDRVTLRREEDDFALGSEIVVLPRHGELMVRVPFCTLRARVGSSETAIEVDGGFAEIYHDRVTILTPAARMAGTQSLTCGTGE